MATTSGKQWVKTDQDPLTNKTVAAPFGHASGSPCRGLPRGGRVFCASWPDDTCARETCRASETGHRLSAPPGCLRGKTRASQVTRPSSSYVLWSNTPPDTAPSSPNTQGAIIAFDVIQHSRHPGRIGFGAAVPRPARSRTYASPVAFLPPSQGWLPARAGSPLAGRVSHPLDDRQNFMKASHPPIPIDPQGLVALECLSIGRPPELSNKTAS